MKLPAEMTEGEFVDIVNDIADKLCNKFKFGYFGADDIRQECFIQAIDGLERYDNSRPLANFLWIHIKNRLCNLKRDKYFRLEKPCAKCPLGAYVAKKDLCRAYAQKEDCEWYRAWVAKNQTKQNIMNPICINYAGDSSESRESLISHVATKEIIDVIDANISISSRKYWLQKKAGMFISKKQEELLIAEIRCILEENNIDVSQTWEI